MATKVSMCNIALARAGTGASIQSLTENSEEARYCNIFYEQARDQTLNDHEWGFAVRYEALALTGDAPTNWDYQYDYPADCIRALNIVNRLGRNKPPIPFTVASLGDDVGKVILTSQEDAELRYIARIENPTAYSPAFVQAFTWRLAAELILPLKQDEKRADFANKMYQAALSNAKATDANEKAEDPVQDMHEPDWISERN